MKKILSTSGIVFLIIVFFASCKKDEITDCNLIAAKIIRYDCDRVILQLLTPEAIGDADWEDTHTGARYSNVVSYYNNCALGAITHCEIDTVYVRVKKINENLRAEDCIQCQAISSSPPQTRVDFLEVSISACAEPSRD